jgi:hypothetical protein
VEIAPRSILAIIPPTIKPVFRRRRNIYGEFHTGMPLKRVLRRIERVSTST